MIVTTEAIVLKSKKFRDTSKLVTLYTEDFGKCTVVANGARRAKNKFGSALEPTACSSVTMYKHPNKDLHTLSAAETSIPLRVISDSFELLTTAMSMLELIYTTQLDEEQNPNLYHLLRYSLQILNTEPEYPHSLLIAFKLHLASEMGFAVDPSQCPESGEVVTPDQAEEFVLSLADAAPFSPPLALNRAGFRLPASALAALQHFATAPLEEAALYALLPGAETLLNDFFTRYLEYHLGKRITQRTTKFLHDTEG